MGRSEVTVRCPTISICTSVGSTISDMIARVDGAMACGRRRDGGLERRSSVIDLITLIKEEAGEVAEQGLQ